MGPSMHEASLVAQTAKNMPAMQETWVQCLGSEEALEGKSFSENWSGDSTNEKQDKNFLSRIGLGEGFYANCL